MRTEYLRKASREEVTYLRSILNHQLGVDVADKVIPSDILVKVSPRTGRIREVFLPNGLKIASIRASSYTFNLTIHAARIIKDLVKPIRLRLVVVNEIAEDIIKFSTNVFSKHVLDVDEELRSGDEVLIVDEDDNLLCVGRMLLSPYEVMFFTRGIAARVRGCVSHG